MSEPQKKSTKPLGRPKNCCSISSKMTAQGCLLNKLKYDSCDACLGIDGHEDHIDDTLGKLLALRGVGVIQIPAQKAALLEAKGHTPAQIEAIMDLLLDGRLCERVEVIDPIAKSRLRPEV